MGAFKNYCIFVLTSILMLGLQNSFEAVALFENTGPTLNDIILRSKRQYDYYYNYDYDYELGNLCYNCSGTLNECGNARVETDDKWQCYKYDTCFLSRQEKSNGDEVYYRYCDQPTFYSACFEQDGFTCQTFEHDWWCDWCCYDNLCNSMQWKFPSGLDYVGDPDVTTSYPDGMPNQTQTGTPALQTTISSTRPSVSTTLTKESTSSLKGSTTISLQESSTRSSVKPSTSSSSASPTSTSMTPPVRSSSVSSTGASLVTSTSATQKSPSNRMSCYKCTGTLVYCGLSRDSSSESETCGASVSQCYVKWETKPNGLDTIYKRGCLSSSMVSFDVNKLCPRGILKGCVDNVCAMCCNDNLCNSMLWFYSSAPSQQVTFMRWIWVLGFNLILTYIFV